MAATYLKVPFKANSEVRSLGARFDSQLRQWYVPGGHELGPFKSWRDGRDRPALDIRT